MLRRLVLLLLLMLLGTSAGIAGCALAAKHPTPAQQADTRRQIADVIDRLTLAENIGAQALRELARSSVSPDLKIAIGCDVLKAVGDDAPSTTVTTQCGAVPTRAAAPLHLAVKAAQEAGSCASRQNTIAVALQVLQPLWDHLARSGVQLLEILGGSLKFVLAPLQTPAPCGGVA